MAKENLSAQATESNPVQEWQKDRFEMAQEISKNVLEPLSLFAELIRGYDCESSTPKYDFLPQEIASMLRLIVLGGYVDMKALCSDWGATFNLMTHDIMVDMDDQWIELVNKNHEQNQKKARL